MSYNPYSLEGKTIMITGASSGIGRDAAVICSKLGAKLIVTGRHEERLKATLNNLSGGGHVMIVSDLDSDEGIDKLVFASPVIDGLVGNAGITGRKTVQFVKRKDLEEVYSTNVFGNLLLIKSLTKTKKISKGGSIVVTSSLSAKLSSIGQSVYASSKAALCAMMRTCALELAPKGIRVNAVLPGMVETEMVTGGILSEDDRMADVLNYPLGRYGRPDDIAYGISFLLSDASRWITGQELVIDGGRSLK